MSASVSPLPIAIIAAPANGATLSAREEPTIVELVWTATAVAVPVQFFVEVVALKADSPRELFAGYHEAIQHLLGLLPVSLDWPDRGAACAKFTV